MADRIKHIGYLALCNGKNYDYDRRITRIDLSAREYRDLGVRHRLRNEPPYRVCKRCLRAVEKREQRNG
jgi:hypothetical protein